MSRSPATCSQTWQRIEGFSEPTTNPVGRRIFSHDLDVELISNGDSVIAVNGKGRIAQGRPSPTVLPSSSAADRETSQNRQSLHPSRATEEFRTDERSQIPQHTYLPHFRLPEFPRRNTPTNANAQPHAQASPLVPVHHQPLHAPTKQAPLPRQQRASRVALALRDSGHPSSKPETALAVARILDPRERHPDARAVADALVDEVDVRRERRVHRGGERGEERRVDEASLEAPPPWGERRRLVDLLLTPRSVRLC